MPKRALDRNIICAVTEVSVSKRDRPTERTNERNRTATTRTIKTMTQPPPQYQMPPNMSPPRYHDVGVEQHQRQHGTPSTSDQRRENQLGASAEHAVGTHAEYNHSTSSAGESSHSNAENTNRNNGEEGRRSKSRSTANGGGGKLSLDGTMAAAAASLVVSNDDDDVREHYSNGQSDEEEEDDASTATARVNNSGIRIGRTGNPIGSMGHLLDDMEDVLVNGIRLDDGANDKGEDGSGEGTNGGETRGEEASSSSSNNSNTSPEFPLEISTEGGTSAMLAVGHVMGTTTTTTNVEQAKVVVGEVDAANTGAAAAIDAQSSVLDHSQSSRRPQRAPSPHCNVILNPSNSSRRAPSPYTIGDDYSEISEDRTFNTISDMSSMMSRLEIQKLLEHGRQQGRMMMDANSNGEVGARGECVGGVGGGGNAVPPTVIHGGGKSDAIMVLYANQSLYASDPQHIHRPTVYAHQRGGGIQRSSALHNAGQQRIAVDMRDHRISPHMQQRNGASLPRSSQASFASSLPHEHYVTSTSASGSSADDGGAPSLMLAAASSAVEDSTVAPSLPGTSIGPSQERPTSPSTIPSLPRPTYGSDEDSLIPRDHGGALALAPPMPPKSPIAARFTSRHQDDDSDCADSLIQGSVDDGRGTDERHYAHGTVSKIPYSPNFASKHLDEEDDDNSFIQRSDAIEESPLFGPYTIQQQPHRYPPNYHNDHLQYPQYMTPPIRMNFVYPNHPHHQQQGIPIMPISGSESQTASLNSMQSQSMDGIPHLLYALSSNSFSTSNGMPNNKAQPVGVPGVPSLPSLTSTPPVSAATSPTYALSGSQPTSPVNSDFGGSPKSNSHASNRASSQTTISSTSVGTSVEEGRYELRSAAPVQHISSSSSGNVSSNENIKGGDHHKRTSSATSISLSSNSSEKRSAMSVLELSSKSLADALIPHDEDEESVAEGEGKHNRSNNNSNEKVVSDGGYSADRSSLDFHRGDDFSESGTSFGLDLKQGLPMNVTSASEDEDSRYLNHNENKGTGVPLKASQSIFTKPFHHQEFPSLMDSDTSMSSSFASVATPSLTVNLVESGREGSKEERDGLPHSPEGMGEMSSRFVYNDNGDVAGAMAPIQYYEAPKGSVPLEQFPVATAGVDPKMGIGYEQQRYIVDLEKINEESSGNELASNGLSISSKSSRSGQKRAAAPGVRVSPAIQSKQMQPNGAMNAASAPSNAHGFARPQVLQQQPNQQFYNYRHKYYTEQYHYCDDQYTHGHASKADDDTDSTCSSVTLSQAFQNSMQGEDDSCASSVTDEYTQSSSLASTVSSVTLSHALSVDRHEHNQGFYVATRLGDYVEVPNDDAGVGDEVDEKDECDKKDIGRDHAEKDTTKSEEDTFGDSTSKSPHDNSTVSDNAISIDSPGGDIDAVSSTPAVATSAQVATTSEGIETDILNMLIPECGVPIPSVMAKMGKQKSKGGMLLPWHSTRSIQNYQYGGRKKRSGRNHSSNSSIFSISSVHTFRG